MAAIDKCQSFVRRHSLSIVSTAILLTWICLYIKSDPSTHFGSFFGNAIADWSGVVVTVLATKYLYEIHSKDSRRPPKESLSSVRAFFHNHGLTVFLVVTGIGWVVLYSRLNPDAKWGQVVGNIVSEWTQIFGTIVMTKRLIEPRAKV